MFFFLSILDNKKLNKISDLSNLSSSKSKQVYHQRSTKLNFPRNEQKTVEDIIFRATGMTSKQLASECLQFGETFSSKPWLRQLDIALHSSRNRIQRGRPRTSIPESRWHDSTSLWKEVRILRPLSDLPTRLRLLALGISEKNCTSYVEDIVSFKIYPLEFPVNFIITPWISSRFSHNPMEFLTFLH